MLDYIVMQMRKVNREKGYEFVSCWARFSKAPETFRARKAIFSSSVSENGEVYRPETSCVKRTSVYIKNT